MLSGPGPSSDHQPLTSSPVNLDRRAVGLDEREEAVEEVGDEGKWALCVYKEINSGGWFLVLVWVGDTLDRLVL